MAYLAITKDAADFFTSHADARRALARALVELLHNGRLRSCMGKARELRVAQSPDGHVLAIWHPDYLNGIGNEDWGFVTLSGTAGLLDEPEIIEGTLERALYIVDQRLQGLLLDDRLIHKKLDGGIFRCLASRGEVGRQLSFACYEERTSARAREVHAILIAGPMRGEDRLVGHLRTASKSLRRLIDLADQLIGPTLRPLLELSFLPPAPSNKPTPSGVAETRSPVRDEAVPDGVAADTHSLTYDDWIAPGSPLHSEQRRILEADLLESQPLRIVGTAGSGKTLLMSLLAFRQLQKAASSKINRRLLYLTHNSAMSDAVFGRFLDLGAEPFFAESSPQRLEIMTLADYARDKLEISDQYVIDKEAQATKDFQLIYVREALDKILRSNSGSVTPLLKAVAEQEPLRDVFARLLVVEIGTAIKGHGFQSDKRRYVEAERPLSRLHGILNPAERGVVFDIFELYNDAVFRGQNLLDSDDVALSLLGRLRTPLWQMQRLQLGCDFLFVDETQLFNENERRLFPLLTRSAVGHVPVALALDEAQELSGATQPGFGSLGIASIKQEELHTTHRCTPAILELAFYVIQRTTDLFGPEFPDFTASSATLVSEAHVAADSPRFLREPADSHGLPSFVADAVQNLRKANLRTIAISFHTSRAMTEFEACFKQRKLPVQILTQRGEKIRGDAPTVVLARAEDIGGQEFDVVICIGLEQGVTPPPVVGNQPLEAALEQRSLREMYLAFTRARYRVLVVISKGAAPTAVLQSAAGIARIREIEPDRRRH